MGIVTAEEMGAESDAESLVQMLMDQDAAFCERDTQMRGLDLEDKPLKGDCVIVTDSAFFFDGENQIKIDVRQDRDKSRAWLLRVNGESLIELADVNFF